MHVYSNDADKVIASSVDEAWEIWCREIGEDREYYDSVDDDFWFTVPDATELPIYEGDDCVFIADKSKVVTKTASGWINHYSGRSRYLCTNEC